MTRRDFLARTSSAAALPFLPWRIAHAQSAMFISLPPWAVARNVGWPEQARLAARVGYAGIDWAFAAARKAGLEATRALLAELKIQPTITNLPMQGTLGADEAAFADRLPQLADDAAFAAGIGCRNFQLVLTATTPAGQSKSDRWQTVRNRLSAISAVLAKHDMRLGLEFLGPLVFRTGRGGGGRAGAAAPDAPAPVPFVWTLPETVKLAVECGPNIGVTLDAWHWYHSGGTVADILATDRARVVHVHVSDARTMAPRTSGTTCACCRARASSTWSGSFARSRRLATRVAWRQKPSARGFLTRCRPRRAPGWHSKRPRRS